MQPPTSCMTVTISHDRVVMYTQHGGPLASGSGSLGFGPYTVYLTCNKDVSVFMNPHHTSQIKHTSFMKTETHLNYKAEEQTHIPKTQTVHDELVTERMDARQAIQPHLNGVTETPLRHLLPWA